VADIYLQTFARDRHDLSATRVQALEAVAFQCPIEGNGWWEIGGEALIFTTDFFYHGGHRGHGV